MYPVPQDFRGRRRVLSALPYPAAGRRTQEAITGEAQHAGFGRTSAVATQCAPWLECSRDAVSGLLARDHP
jgi:hypothetical protein